jgi:chromosomal replication initiator protein
MTAVVWEKCLSSLQQELSSQQFNTWIRPLTLDDQSATETEFCLLAPNRFVLDWVNEKFLYRIKELVQDFFSSEHLQVPKTVNVKVSAARQASFQNYQIGQESSPEVMKEAPFSSAAFAPERINKKQAFDQPASESQNHSASFGGMTSNTLSGSHVSPYGNGAEPFSDRSSVPVVPAPN